MKDQNWIERWENKQIGFHENEVNGFLKKHYEKLELQKDDTIFIPLCGKTLDIAWLANLGYKVVGCELSPIAIKELFEEMGVTPQVIDSKAHTIYTYENITIFVGDFFTLTKEDIGKIDAIYDRASLVALIPELRQKYAPHLQKISDHAKQLLISFEYDQSVHLKPPYCVKKQEIEGYYLENYNIELLESVLLEGGLKGQYEAKEEIWLLHKK